MSRNIVEHTEQPIAKDTTNLRNMGGFRYDDLWSKDKDGEYLEESFVSRWKDCIDNKNFPEIQNEHAKMVTMRVLDNLGKELAQKNSRYKDSKFLSEASNTTSGISTWDNVLIQMVRRTAPINIGFEIFGVQPLSTPTGVIFAMRSHYPSVGGNPQTGAEALFDEANTAHGGTGTHVTPLDPFASTVNDGKAMATSVGEALTSWSRMGLSISKVTAEAKTRKLSAYYTAELRQDLASVHGIDAQATLADMLATEIVAETNRELVRRMYWGAELGGKYDSGTSAYSGAFDLTADADGRWSVERFKGLLFAIEKDANTIAQRTRRGKGNFIVCSPNVASALNMTGLLSNTPALSSVTNMHVDPATVAYAGNISSYRVYVDPYADTTSDFYVVGYKGMTEMDAGIFYSPYIPLQFLSGTNPDNFDSSIGFMTRYAITENPFASNLINSNVYYRKSAVTGIA